MALRAREAHRGARECGTRQAGRADRGATPIRPAQGRLQVQPALARGARRRARQARAVAARHTRPARRSPRRVQRVAHRSRRDASARRAGRGAPRRVQASLCGASRPQAGRVRQVEERPGARHWRREARHRAPQALHACARCRARARARHAASRVRQRVRAGDAQARTRVADAGGRDGRRSSRQGARGRCIDHI